jgi:hypothetical protein
MSANQLPLSKLTLSLWLSHRWFPCTAGGDKERQFVRGKPREAGEEAAARRAWAELTGVEEDVPVLAAPSERRIILTDGD